MRLFCYITCLLLFQACYFLGPSPKNRLRKIGSLKPLDVAIVPGLPLYEGRCDTLLKTRLLWSEFLYKKGYVKNIIYSGNAVYSPWVEGTSMALIANSLGIPGEHICIDTVAEHSVENLFYGYRLAKKNGFKTMAVATDPVQCALLHRFAKKNFKENIYFIPVVYDSISDRMALTLEIDTTLTKKGNFVSIEKQGYKKRWRGTRGKNIPQSSTHTQAGRD
jgi:hypothetical protein